MSSIIRVEKTKDYTVMCNYHFKEKQMSLKAKGLLSLMLSLPEDWNYTIAGLVAICKENESAIKSTLTELKEFGYLNIIKRLPNETQTGRIEYEYIIYEKPLKDKKQDISKQGLENLGVGILSVENPIQLNTNKLNTNKLNTNTISNKLDIDIVENEKPKTSKKESKIDLVMQENIKCIIGYLNESIGSNYKYNSKQTIKDITARFKDGFILDDFYDVIDKKVKEWFNTEMQQYLRPSTLFGTKFEQYLNQLPPKFAGSITSKYSSKPKFDNTADYTPPKGIASMTKEEKEKFYNTELARDKDGNLLEF